MSMPVGSRRFLGGVLLLLLGALPGMALADRIKDLTTIAGVRANPLIGFGLVVGLQGTGDGTDLSVTGQSMRSLLDRLGVSQDGPRSDFDRAQQAGQMDVANSAAVLVTADLPPFAKPGQRLDVNVSTIGPATSLRGGTLVMTRLYGVDGNVYAIAQGPTTVTGIEVNAAGSSVSIGVPTAGRVPNGAMVERVVETPFTSAEHVVMNVRESDFSTVSAIVQAINQNFGAGTARALDGTSLAVRAPMDLDQRVTFLGLVQEMEVTPGEPPARVVVNSRTGTVVISRNVRVTAAAVNHGTLSVTVSAATQVSQAQPFAPGGQTVVTEQADITVDEPVVPMFLFQPGIELREIVDAVNLVGATPSSLIAILEALKASGSLRADLVVI
jgi:flagellar P-ring protein precursor FlgI